jgi:hypothetical protein
MRLSLGLSRSRWAAFGAAVAVTLGAGGVSWVGATISSGSKAVFVPITPCRLVDTRPSAPLTAKQTKTYPVHGTNGACTIPNGATAISGNLTITDPTDDGFMTVAPAGGVGNSSNLNWLRGQSPTPNAFTVALSAGGAIDVFNDRGTVNVVIDINGYYEDHNHDDRYYTKAQTDAAVGAKANAADVYTKAQVDNSAAASLKAAGFVIGGTGEVFPGSQPVGTWTVSKTGTGSYSIAMAGFVTAADCAASNYWPTVLVTTHSTTTVASVTGMGISGCPTSGNLSISISTRAGDTNASTNSDFFFSVMKQNTSGLVPAELRPVDGCFDTMCAGGS